MVPTTLSYTVQAATAAEALTAARNIASAFFGGLTGVVVTTSDTIVPADGDGQGNVTKWSVPVTAVK
jgi:hypothetical protein